MVKVLVWAAATVQSEKNTGKRWTTNISAQGSQDWVGYETNSLHVGNIPLNIKRTTTTIHLKKGWIMAYVKLVQVNFSSWLWFIWNSYN